MSSYPDDEGVLPPETSNEELMRVYLQDVLSEDTVQGCSGNLADKCVKESVDDTARILDGRQDSALIGGLPAQIKAVEREGYETAWSLFSHRTTNDLDILSMNPSEVRKMFRSSNYSEENLDIDVIGAGLFDDSQVAENIVNQSKSIRLEDIGEDSAIRLPQDTHLLYTKLHDGYGRYSRGTRYDAWRMMDSDVFHIDYNQLERLLDGNPEGLDTYRSIADEI
jgi:hypothetical protein